VATTAERATELHRRHGWLTAWGVEAFCSTPPKPSRKYPLLDPEVVLGGLYVPTDGIAKAVRAVDAQTRRAAARGATILTRHEVLDITVADGQVTGVVTDHGEIAGRHRGLLCRHLGPVIAAKVGMNLPLTPLAHQLAWTSAVPALAGRTEEAVLPILRHQDQDLYYASGGEGLGVATTATVRCRSERRILPTRRRGRNAERPAVHRRGFRGGMEQTRSCCPRPAMPRSRRHHGLFSFTIQPAADRRIG